VSSKQTFVERTYSFRLYACFMICSFGSSQGCLKIPWLFQRVFQTDGFLDVFVQCLGMLLGLLSGQMPAALAVCRELSIELREVLFRTLNIDAIGCCRNEATGYRIWWTILSFLESSTFVIGACGILWVNWIWIKVDLLERLDNDFGTLAV
jgi:hypothetical protein